MNTLDYHKKHLVDLVIQLREVAAIKEQPSPVVWEKKRLEIEEAALFIESFTIPKIPDEDPGWKGSGNGRLAEFVPAPAVDTEVTADESSAGVPFIVPQRNGAK